MGIEQKKIVFPDDHENHPGVTYEYEELDDGTTEERSYKREEHPEGPPPWANPAENAKEKPPEVSGNS